MEISTVSPQVAENEKPIEVAPVAPAVPTPPVENSKNCPDCKGEGLIGDPTSGYHDKCETCAGTGIVQKVRESNFPEGTVIIRTDGTFKVNKEGSLIKIKQ